jgi:hypothetical protein
MRRTAGELDYEFNQRELELAQVELKKALMLANYSSITQGKLKQAIDAKSKARFLCMRATARLASAKIEGR